MPAEQTATGTILVKPQGQVARLVAFAGPLPVEGPVVGLDLGLNAFAVASDG